ncbi:MAG: recombinase family protein [Gemmataceae bacterium]
MKKAAVYIRMSTDDQADSPDRQRSQIRPYCERQGYKVVKEYVDLGMRGWDDTRPEFQKLLRDAKDGQFDVIVVDELSRLSRQSPMEYVVTVAHPLSQADVALESVAEGRQDWNELVGMILMAVRQDKANQESVTLGRRVATGMNKKALEARMYPGRAPYGYRHVLNSTGDRVGLEPGDPEHVQVVKLIFDLYLNRDKSLDTIVFELNKRGIPSPQEAKWGKTTVGNILRNPTYAGSYVWGRVPQGRYFRCDGGEVVARKRGERSGRSPREKWHIIPNRHTPLIEPSVFDQTQEKLVANRSRTSSSRKNDTYPLAEKLYCRCGHVMYGTWIRSGGEKVTSYRCGANMSKGGSNVCPPHTVRESVVLKALIAAIKDNFLQSDSLERLREELKNQAGETASKGKSEADRLRKKLSQLDKQIADAERKLLRLPDDVMDAVVAQIRELKSEKATVQAQLDELPAHVPAPTTNLDALVKKVQRLEEVIESADPNDVRVFLREAIARVDLHFETVQKKKVCRYPLKGGVIQLFGFDDPDRLGRGAARKCGRCSVR